MGNVHDRGGGGMSMTVGGVRNSGGWGNVCNSGGNVRNSGGNVCNSGGNVRNSRGNVCNSGGNVCDSGEIEYGLGNLGVEIVIHNSAEIAFDDTLNNPSGFERINFRSESISWDLTTYYIET